MDRCPSVKYDLLGVGKLNFDIVKAPEGRATYVGGSVPNTISDAARLGLRTSLIARVGKDREGSASLKELLRRGVDISHMMIDESPTSTCEITITETRDRVYTTPPSKWTAYDRSRHSAVVKDSRAVFVTRGVIGFGDCAEDCDVSGVFWASVLQSPIDANSTGIKNLVQHPPQLLFGNEEEAAIGKRAVEAVLSNGGTVVITLGGRGCKVMSGSTEKRYGSFETKMLDATGAGDAFAAGYLFGILRGFDEERTATVANACGALAVAEKGPVAELTWRRVENFLSERELNKP
ncbi:MAG: PfkB family carbohydrate kinase [Candidatus Micrarchaeales archaeon]|nr:PfkB family carbohydrate kinase [Candidatus Micrarchaeales archaeon]